MLSTRHYFSSLASWNSIRNTVCLLMASFLCLSASRPVAVPQPSTEHDGNTYATSDGVKFRVETVATGLEVPWSMAFEGKDLYFTERRGKLWVLRNGDHLPSLIGEIKGVHSYGEGGLMGLAFHPHFKENKFVYLSLSYEIDGRTLNRVVRFNLIDGRLTSERTIIARLPGAGIHNGCRIRFGPDGKLYITTGDGAHREIAQDTMSLGGKILRVNDDGSIPSDNPFPDSPVYTLGHRNGQGLDWHPEFGLLFESEHGPSGFDGPGGGDEINLIEPGKNYGWPIVHHRARADGMVSPVAEFTPAVAPSGASFYSGSLFPVFQNNFFVATLVGKRLLRVEIDFTTGRTVSRVEPLLENAYGRLRDVEEGPDGAIYFCTSNRDGRGNPTSEDDRILKIVPVP